MTRSTRFQVNEITAAADHVIAELEHDPGSVMLLPLPHGLSPRERADSIDHPAAVVAEIRDRGWGVKTHARNTPAGSAFAIELLGHMSDL